MNIPKKQWGMFMIAFGELTWQWKIAICWKWNPPKPVINGGFSVAMLDHQGVDKVDTCPIPNICSPIIHHNPEVWLKIWNYSSMFATTNQEKTQVTILKNHLTWELGCCPRILELRSCSRTWNETYSLGTCSLECPCCCAISRLNDIELPNMVA